MNFPRSLRRFLIGYTILLLLAAGILVFVLTRLARLQMTESNKSKMNDVALLMVKHIEDQPAGINESGLVDHVRRTGLQTGMQVTLIRPDGEVAVDSNSENADSQSQANREEIQAASKSEFGFSERFDSQTNKPMMYLARRIDSSDDEQPSGFVRVGSSVDWIDSTIGSIQKYTWIGLLSLGALTALLISLFARKRMQPLTEFSSVAKQIGSGDYSATSPSLARRTDEWGELGMSFQQMQTDLTRREERLVQNGQRLEAVLSSMIEGVVAIEPDGKVMLANGAACDMLALTRPEIVRKKLFEVARIPELQAAIEKTQTERTFSETEFKTLSKPQKILSARVSILEDNTKPGVVIVLHDVSALRQLETMRQDFVANVSHELKTPLASIKAYAETLRLGAIHDEEKNLHFVEQIEFHSELLNRQIQDLLELARVESEEKTFQISDVDVNSVCKSCHDQFQRIASARHIDLKLELSQPDPIVRADHEATNTILKNLVVNAIHYTPNYGSVTISTARENEFAIITVKDSGIGIAKDQQARVFERFYRVDKARSRDMGGTGLGLSIVKHLSQAFGGSVELESQIGKGSTFRIFLPLIS